MTRQTAIPLGILAGMIAGLILVSGQQAGVAAQALGIGLAALPLFLVGLGAGWLSLALAIAGGAGVAVWGAGAQGAAVFLVSAAAPAVVLVPAALARPEPPSAGRLVLALTGLGLAAFALAELSALSEPGGLEGLVRRQVRDVLDVVPTTLGMTLPQPAPELAARFARWMVGASIAGQMLNAAGVGILAQEALARFGWNRRPTPAMASLALPAWLGIAFLASLVAATAGGGGVAFVGLNLAEILAVPMLLLGFAVIHRTLIGRPGRMPVLIGMYVVMVLVWPALPVVVLGLIEQARSLRRGPSALEP